MKKVYEKYEKIIKIVLIVIWMGIVFNFSNQGGNESSGTSSKVTKVVVNIVTKDKEEPDHQTIEKIEKMGYAKLPVCIAKTQYSLSDDSKNLQDQGKYKITIRDIELKAGAGFVVALAGKIMTMPGLPKKPSAENIDIDEDGNISGIF